MSNLKFIFVLLLILICSCSSQRNIANDFYSSMQSGEFDKAYSLLSNNDKKIISREEFIGKTELHQALKKKYWSHVKYTLLPIHDNDNITVEIELTAPNLGGILGKEIAQMLVSFTSSNEYQMDEIKRNTHLLDLLNKGNFDYITFQKTIYILTENGNQKVFLNIRDEKEVFRLLQEAISYGRSENDEHAISKLEEILAIDPENKLAKRYMELLVDPKQYMTE